MKKRTGVLIHGFLLPTEKWEETMWGKPPDLLGRLPKGVLVALEENAEMIVFGTGGSEKDGKKEAVYIRDYLLERFLELMAFREFQSSGINLEETREWVRNIARVEIQSVNTHQETEFVGVMFEEAGMERVIAVTSPTHVPRAVNEALAFYGRPGSKIALHNVSIQSSDVGWALNKEVVIFEPPHRPDDPMGNLRQKVAKMLLHPEKLLEIKKALDL